MASLSIVVPTLNEAGHIAATLHALAPLRKRGAEVIVVDGGSSDGTTEVARALADRLIEAPRGRARQLNAGAAAARGDVLLFLHADTVLPEHADRLIADGIDSGAWRWGRFDVRIDGRHMLLPAIAAAMNWRSQVTGIATGDQAMFAARDAFGAVGGFPDIALMEDIELSRRLKRLGRPLCLAARVTTSGRRWESRGVLRTVLLMWRLRLAHFFGADPADLARRYAGGR